MTRHDDESVQCVGQNKQDKIFRFVYSSNKSRLGYSYHSTTTMFINVHVVDPAYWFMVKDCILEWIAMKFGIHGPRRMKMILVSMSNIHLKVPFGVFDH